MRAESGEGREGRGATFFASELVSGCALWYDASGHRRRPSRWSGRCSAAALERLWEAPRGTAEAPEDASLTCQAIRTTAVRHEHAGVRGNGGAGAASAGPGARGELTVGSRHMSPRMKLVSA